jgi:outer membrane protein TolC
VRYAANLMARARNLPRTGIATIVRAEPEAGSPPRYTAAEEYTIDLGSAVGRLGALQAAQAELAQAAATLSATRRATASAVLDAFFAVGNDEAQALAQAETVSLATRTMTAAGERHRAGIGPALDMDRARSVLAAAEADRAATAAALAGDRIGLATLVGHGSPSLAMPALPSALPEVATVTDAAVRANPAVAAAQAALTASEAAALLARAQVRPGVSIGAGIGVTRQAGAQNVGPAADISFTVPFGSGFTRANVAAADAAVLVAKANLEQSRREAARGALHAWTVARTALARLAGLRTASDASRHVAEADLAGYRLGAVSSADLVAAQTQAATARAALETATVQALQAYAQLQFEIGALG